MTSQQIIYDGIICNYLPEKFIWSSDGQREWFLKVMEICGAV